MYKKINSKWIKDLNVRSETNYIEANLGTKLMDLCLREDCMNLTPKSREVNAKINEWDYQTKKLLHSKRNGQQSKKETSPIGENTCKQQLQQGVNIQNAYKNSDNSTPNSPIKKWAKGLNRHFYQENI